MAMAILSERILITGISGFTGFWLAKALRDLGHEVHGTTITPIENAHEHTCDLRDIQAIRDLTNAIRPSYVIHLAAVSFVNEENISLMYDVNVIGTCNLLDALCELGTHVKKVILASSATVYGDQYEEILHEKMCPKPKNHYGCSKLSMEHMATTYYQKLPIIIARPFNYTGIKQEEHFVIPKIVSHFKTWKSTIELGNLNVYREFNDINYVVDVYCKLLFSNITHETINICSGRVISLQEVLMTMQKIAAYNINIEVNNRFVRQNEIESLRGSTDKLKELLGDIPQIAFETTLKTMYEGCL